MRCDAYIQDVTPSVRKLKFELFGHDQVILHEHDIRKKSGPFSALGKDERDALMDGLTQTIRDCAMTVVAVVIDKIAHKKRYARPEHPYHLAMQYGLERVHRVLQQAGQAGRSTAIVCESRGAREDRDLELEFRRVCDGANFQQLAFPFKLIMADKRSNSEGLQLADLLARPIGLHVLRPDQSNRAWDVIKTKIFANAHGVIAGHGLKVFP